MQQNQWFLRPIMPVIVRWFTLPLPLTHSHGRVTCTAFIAHCLRQLQDLTLSLPLTHSHGRVTHSIYCTPSTSVTGSHSQSQSHYSDLVTLSVLVMYCLCQSQDFSSLSPSLSHYSDLVTLSVLVMYCLCQSQDFSSLSPSLSHYSDLVTLSVLVMYCLCQSQDFSSLSPSSLVEALSSWWSLTVLGTVCFLCSPASCHTLPW